MRRLAGKLGVPDCISYFLARAMARPTREKYYPPAQWLEAVFLTLAVCEGRGAQLEMIQGVREFVEAPNGFDTRTLDDAKLAAQGQLVWMREALVFHDRIKAEAVDGRCVRDWVKNQLAASRDESTLANGLEISWARLMTTLYPSPVEIEVGDQDDETAIVCLPHSAGPVPVTFVVLTRIKLGQHIQLNTPAALDYWRRITRFEVLLRASGIVPADVLREAQRQLHLGRSGSEETGPKMYTVL